MILFLVEIGGGVARRASSGVARGQGVGPPPEHVVRAEARAVVPELCGPDILAECILLHVCET